MGGGTWDSRVYASTTTRNINAGTSFGYDSYAKTNRVRAAHESLNPLSVAGPASPFAGRNIRESRDSAEHPNSTPIAIFFDETGSMGYVPREIQKQLGTLFNLLIDGQYASDPQVLIGAYGDADVDFVALQVGQFESDNRIDDALDNLYLEGAGGGNGFEHSALPWYYVATHTDTDNFNKRGKRGYLFTIGDEITGKLTSRAIKRYTGDDVETDITPRQALAMASEKWNVFHIVIDNFVAQGQGSVKFYTNLLGPNAIVIQDINDLAELIATVVGFFEGRVTTTTAPTASATQIKKIQSRPRLAIERI